MSDPARIEEIRRNNNGAGKVPTSDVAFLLGEIERLHNAFNAAHAATVADLLAPAGWSWTVSRFRNHPWADCGSAELHSPYSCDPVFKAIGRTPIAALKAALADAALNAPPPAPRGEDRAKEFCREDRNRVCHICNKTTNLCCSDCRIDLGARVYVCSETSCRDRHEAICPGNKTAIQEKGAAAERAAIVAWLRNAAQFERIRRQIGTYALMEAAEAIGRGDHARPEPEGGERCLQCRESVSEDWCFCPWCGEDFTLSEAGRG